MSFTELKLSKTELEMFEAIRAEIIRKTGTDLTEEQLIEISLKTLNEIVGDIGKNCLPDIGLSK